MEPCTTCTGPSGSAPDVPYTPFDPTITGIFGSNDPILGDTAVEGRFDRAGRRVFGYAGWKFGSTYDGNESALWGFSVPAAPRVLPLGVQPLGTGYLSPHGGGIIRICAFTWIANADAAVILIDSAAFGDGNPVGDEAPFVWAADDQLVVQFDYEAADPA